MSQNKIGIVVQARTGSSRLPNKIIKPFYKNQSILEIILDKLKHTKISIIVATTIEESDNIVEKITISKGLKVHRGETDNVLKRSVDAAYKLNLKNMVRVCADNPFLNIDYLNNLITFFTQEKPDYASYCLNDNLPVIKSHQGIWAEIVKLSALEKVLELTSEKLYLEHVTNFIYANPGIFNVKFINAPDFLYNNNDIRLTVDTEEDFQMAARLYKLYVENNKFVDMKKFIEYIDHSDEIIKKMQSEISKNIK